MISKWVYNIFFKRTSSFILTSVVGAVFFERAFDSFFDSFYERHNRGVREYILNNAHCIAFVFTEIMDAH